MNLNINMGAGFQQRGMQGFGGPGSFGGLAVPAVSVVPAAIRAVLVR